MPTTFADLGVPDRLVAALAARGIEQPFDVQASAIPDACSPASGAPPNDVPVPSSSLRLVNSRRRSGASWNRSRARRAVA